MLPFIAFSQEYTLSGRVIDKNSNETLIGVNLIFPDLATGVVTNDYGYYSIKLPAGKHRVILTYIGYANAEDEVNISDNTQQNFQLSEASESLDEVVITSDIEALNIKKPEMSVNRLSIGTIKKIPVVFRLSP